MEGGTRQEGRSEKGGIGEEGCTEMTDRHPFGMLIEAEAARAESDLSSMRSRALSVVTTASGIVALLTGLTTFAASKNQSERGLSDGAIWFLGIALGLFVLAAVLALVANRSRTIQRPSGAHLAKLTTEATWYETTAEGGPDTPDQERVSAGVLVTYLVSVRQISDDAARVLNRSLACLVLGLIAASISVVILLNGF